MQVTVGTGPDSWGIWFPDDPKQIPWHRFLDEAVEAGYEWIELGPYGYLPTNPQVLRSELERRGLKVSASYVERHDLEDPAAREALEDEVLHLAEVLAAASDSSLSSTPTPIRTSSTKSRSSFA